MRSLMAMCLLLGLIPHAASVRASAKVLQADLWWGGSSAVDWGTDKVCCCNEFGKDGADQKCYWQQRIPLDTGSGCNWVGKFNPWANKKRISGFTDGVGKKFFVFDVRKYGKNGQCQLDDQSDCDANELVYESKCLALNGRIKLVPDAHGGMHQFVRNDAFFQDVPEAATSPVKEEASDSGSIVVPEANVFEHDVEPLGLQDPADDNLHDVTAQITVEETKLEKVQLGFTNRNIKKCERTESKVFCSILCDMWPPRRGTQTQKKGCHNKSKYNAGKYCKNACSPDEGCSTPAGTPEPENPAKPCD